MNAKIEIIEKMQDYQRQNGRAPTTLRLPLSKAYDLCKLGETDLGRLSHGLAEHGPRYLELSGFLGCRVIIESRPDISVE